MKLLGPCRRGGGDGKVFCDGNFRYFHRRIRDGGGEFCPCTIVCISYTLFSLDLTRVMISPGSRKSLDYYVRRPQLQSFLFTAILGLGRIPYRTL